MHEQMPLNEGDKRIDRIDRASAHKKTFTKPLKTRIYVPKSNDIYKQLFSKPAVLKSTNRRSLINKEMIEVNKLNILASMLPDEILLNQDGEPREFDGAILIADVSGFTELSELYSKMGKGGASRLSSVLNEYMGSMILEILSQGGDVLKFAGDAIMAIFKCTLNVNIHDAVHKALDTSVIIQKSLGEYNTDVNVILKTKIAISAGRVTFSMIGENYLHYVLVGAALCDTKLCESLSKSGQIIVSNKAMRLINQNEYIYEYRNDYQVYEVIAFSDSWRMIQRHYNDSFVSSKDVKDMLDKRESSDSWRMIQRHYNDSFVSSKDVKDMLDKKESSDTHFYGKGDLLQIKSTHAEYLVRPSISLVSAAVEPFLSKFLIPSLKRSINLNEEVYHMNEIRPIVIVFVNLVVETLDSLQLVEICHATFTEIYRITEFHKGSLNKMSLFDKDMMYLIIFGLKGFIHTVQSQMALRCSAEIQTNLSKYENVLSVSVGVVSGDTYCGVVGHEMRREYSVMGVTVNKAARLMMSYPNKVTCDRKTYIESHIESDNFLEVSPHELKGLTNVGPIYQFVEVFKSHIEVIPFSSDYPLLGRDKQMVEFIQRCKEGKKTSIETLLVDKYQISFLIVGESRQGKSTLLNKMFSHAFNERCTCFKITINVNQARDPHFLTFLYMNHIMGFQEDSRREERESIISKCLKGRVPPESYFYLNEILKVEFPVPSNIDLKDENSSAIRKHMFKSLCKQMIKTFTIIFIDDIELADEESILLLTEALQIYYIFFVFTTGNKQQISEEAGRVLKQPHIKSITIGPIKEIFQSKLACHLLAVEGLDIDIEKIIHTKCNGNPGWINACLTSFVQEKIIEVKNMAIADVKVAGYIFKTLDVDNGTNTEQNIDMTNSHAFEFCLNSDGGHFYPLIVGQKNLLSVKIATLKSDINVQEIEIGLPEDIQIIILYDTLSVYEQQIVKCSAVLGKEVLRCMLLYLLQSQERQVAQAIKQLFELGIFTCGRGDFLQRNIVHKKPNSTPNFKSVSCFCTHLKIPDSCQDLPRYANCSYIRFKSEKFMNASYNLLTDPQRKEYHSKAIIYLENESKKCETCGGTYFMNLAFNQRDILFDVEAKVTSDVIFETGKWDKFQSRIKCNDIRKICGPVRSRRINLRSGKSSTDTLAENVLENNVSKVLIFQFGSFSFKNCECDMILYFTYQHLTKHAEGAGLSQKLIETKIIQAGNAIDVGHYTKCLSMLDELALLITERYKERNDGYYVYFIAKVYIYRGKCNYYLQQHNHAQTSFKEASKLLRTKYPKSNTSNVSKACVIAKKTKKFLKNFTYGAKAAQVTLIYELISEQIAVLYAAMYKLFKKNKEYDLCATAASISLQKAVKYSHNHTLILNCYANFILLGQFLGLSHKLEWMQIKSFELAIYALKENVEQKLLLAISNLFYALMLSLATLDKKEMGINLGYMTLQLNKAAGSIRHQWKVVPLLVAYLMTQRQIHDSALLLTRFEIIMKENNDLTGLTWYYALCMDVLLDTSLTIASFNQCKQFYVENIELLTYLADSEAATRLYANMWLWCTRTSTWGFGHVLYKKLKESFTLTKYDTSMNIMTSLRVLESLILSLIKSVNIRDNDLIKIKEWEIRRLMDSIKEAVNTTKIHSGRFMLLKTYFSQVINYKIEKLFLLKNTARHALNIGSYLVYDMIQHNLRVWCKCEPGEIEFFWNQHCNEDNTYTEEQWLKNGNKIFPYSLPILNMLRHY